jgi:hypothetical protein
VGPDAATTQGAENGLHEAVDSTVRKNLQALPSHFLPKVLIVASDDESLSSDARSADDAAVNSDGKTVWAGGHEMTDTPEIESSSRTESKKDSKSMFESGYQ